MMLKSWVSWFMVQYNKIDKLSRNIKSYIQTKFSKDYRTNLCFQNQFTTIKTQLLKMFKNYVSQVFTRKDD